MVRTLADLVAPLTTEEFLCGGPFGQRVAHFSRRPEEVEGLFSWADLNRLLMHHRLAGNRCRLVQERTLCRRDAYTRVIPNRRGELVERLQPAGVMRLLREGATMILDAVDEMHGPIGILAENLAGELHEEVQVNAYASWGTRPAYGPHHDEHDVFVVQVAGEKRWQVFESVSDSRAGEDAVVGVTNKVFDRVIRSGDVIYLPRGWMHDVVAVDRPSLHLTIGIRVRNGLDLFTWLVGQCQDAAPFNRRLPRFSAGRERGRYIRLLRQEFDRLWETDDLLQRFFDDWDTHIPARPHFSLPWIGRDGCDELSDADYLRFSGTSWRCVRTNGAEVVIEADGGTWLLPAPAEDVLRKLSGGNRACVREIIPVGEGDAGKDRSRQLLARMVREGLLCIDTE